MRRARMWSTAPTHTARLGRLSELSYDVTRCPRRQTANLVSLLEEIYDSEFTHAVGLHCETLLDSAFSRAGFNPVAMNVKSWDGQDWTKTNDNLDRVVTKDGIAYGVEIKNTQNYISRVELETKVALARHLGLKPLFVMRFAPKSYKTSTKDKGNANSGNRVAGAPDFVFAGRVSYRVPFVPVALALMASTRGTPS